VHRPASGRRQLSAAPFAGARRPAQALGATGGLLGRAGAPGPPGAGGSFDDLGYGGTINEQSLLVYLLVLTVSTLLALYTGLVRPDTRLIRPRLPRAAA
jgi:hypothetical protein